MEELLEEVGLEGDDSEVDTESCEEKPKLAICSLTKDGRKERRTICNHACDRTKRDERTCLLKRPDPQAGHVEERRKENARHGRDDDRSQLPRHADHLVRIPLQANLQTPSRE